MIVLAVIIFDLFWSRSTCKTSSSPYRSNLRNASTSSVTDAKSAYDCDSSCYEHEKRKGWSRTSESDEETWDGTQTDSSSVHYRRHQRRQARRASRRGGDKGDVTLASSHSSDEEETVVNGGRGELVVKEFNSASLSRGARLGVRDYGPSDLGIPTRDEYLVTSANTTMVQYGQIDQRDLDDGQGDQGDEVFLGGGMDDGLGGYSVPRPMRALYSTQWTSQLDQPTAAFLLHLSQ